MNRRTFVKAASASALSTRIVWPARIEALSRPKRILVLGGTNFVGPAVVEAALLAGHEVTLFNRGITNSGLFPYLEKLRGFRSSELANQNLAALAGRKWDAVIDVWPWEPDVVQFAAETMKDRTDHYLYVSSIAAYDPSAFATAGTNEDAPLVQQNSNNRVYSKGKAESERRLAQLLGDRVTIVRPTAITGFRDDGTVSLHSWLIRAQVGGKHIGPGDGSDPVQFVDVKDVAAFLIEAIDSRRFGTFNLGRRTTPFREFLESCRSATDSDAQFVWIPRDFITKCGLQQADFPYWPRETRKGASQISVQKALGTGWMTRPFQETANDTLLWFHELRAAAASDEYMRTDHLPPDQEAEVIRLWSEQHS